MARLFVVALALSVAVVVAAETSYMGVTKRELIRKLGLPAEITLETGDAPSQETWWYYWEDAAHRLSRADFHFCGNKVCGYVAAFDAKHVVSTETRDGFLRVYRHIVRERKLRGQ